MSAPINTLNKTFVEFLLRKKPKAVRAKTALKDTEPGVFFTVKLPAS